MLRIRGETRKDFAAAGGHSRTQSLLIGTALREYHNALRGSIGRIGPSGGTVGAAVGADADLLAVADAAPGVVVACDPAAAFRVGAVVEDFVDGGAAAAGVDDWPCAGDEASTGCDEAAAAAGAAGLEAGLAIAFTALRHGADNLAHCA